jgi:hypothetical protein
MEPVVEATKEKVTRKKRRTSRRRSAPDYEHYFVAVDRWEHYYGFGRGDPRFHTTPYSHTETLSWTGRVIHPEGLKYPKAVVTLSAREGLMAENAKSDTSIGSMNARDQEISAYVFIPAEHMGQLVGLAVSGRLKTISFVGEPLKWRQGLIRSISLSTEIEEESTK